MCMFPPWLIFSGTLDALSHVMKYTLKTYPGGPLWGKKMEYLVHTVVRQRRSLSPRGRPETLTLMRSWSSKPRETPDEGTQQKHEERWSTGGRGGGAGLERSLGFLNH